MIASTTVEKITTSSQVHIALVDEFIRLTQDKIDRQRDTFTRESLYDLLATLREERAGYLELLSAAALTKAA